MEHSTEVHPIPPTWKSLDSKCRKIFEHTPSTGLSYEDLHQATKLSLKTITTHVGAMIKGGIAQIEPTDRKKIVRFLHGAHLDVDVYLPAHHVEKSESKPSPKLAQASVASVLATIKMVREEIRATPILPLGIRMKGIREALMKVDLEIETNLQFVPPELRPQTLLANGVLRDSSIDLLLRKLEIYLESAPS